MFGAGPVTGGSAGGKDYSFASMMGQLTPHDSAGRGDEKPREGEADAATGGGAGRQDRLGAPLLSQGAQDYLHGAGVMQGDDDKPSTWTQGGPTQGREEGLGPEEQISGKEDLSAMQESTLKGLHTLDDSQRSANHLSGDAPGHTQADDEVYPSACEGQTGAGGKTAPDEQGVAPDQARMQGIDQGTQGWSGEGPAVNLAKPGDFSRDDRSALRGQGILSSRQMQPRSGDNPQGLGEDVPSRRAEGEADDGRDELREEQSTVPEEEFEKQPTTGGGPLQEGAQAAWDAAAQVADRAKGLLGGSKEE